MSAITGTLTDSVGNPVAGALTFKLFQLFEDDSTNPGTLRLPITYSFAILAEADNVDVEVPESETLNIPYLIEFTPTGEDDPALSFYAIIPNVAVDLLLLTPTGITAESLATGALRIAGLLAGDEELSAIVTRPLNFNIQLDAVDTTTVFYFPRASSRGGRTNEIAGLFLSGFDPAEWAISCGVVGSDGVNSPFSFGDSPVINVQSGRTHFRQNVQITSPNTILAYYIQVAPTIDADPLTGSLTLSVTETV
jgi:hypothetical protein